MIGESSTVKIGITTMVLALLSLGLWIGSIYQIHTLKSDRDYWQKQAVANANEAKAETTEAIGCQEKLQNLYLGSYGKSRGKHHAARRAAPGKKLQKAKKDHET